MADRKISGSAESGAGVMMSGFYAPNGEVQARLHDLDVDQGPFSEIALHESEGWTAVLASSEIEPIDPGPSKIGFLRRESHKFFEDLPAWLFRIKAAHIARLHLSQASGFLSLTCLYSEARPGD